VNGDVFRWCNGFPMPRKPNQSGPNIRWIGNDWSREQTSLGRSKGGRHMTTAENILHTHVILYIHRTKYFQCIHQSHVFSFSGLPQSKRHVITEASRCLFLPHSPRQQRCLVLGARPCLIGWMFRIEGTWGKVCMLRMEEDLSC
jgi:hypothetical protein